VIVFAFYMHGNDALGMSGLWAFLHPSKLIVSQGLTSFHRFKLANWNKHTCVIIEIERESCYLCFWIFEIFIFCFLRTFCKFHSTHLQLYCPGTKCPACYEDADLYEDFNMAEMELNLESYEELFGVTLNNSEELFENGGIDSLFGTKDMPIVDSNCQGAVAAEVLFLYFYLLLCMYLCLLICLFLVVTIENKCILRGYHVFFV